MNYPHKTEAEQTTLGHLPHSPYFYDDTPHLSIARYSINGYEPKEVADKRELDVQGVADNAYFYEKTQQDNLAVNIGQR